MNTNQLTHPTGETAAKAAERSGEAVNQHGEVFPPLVLIRVCSRLNSRAAGASAFPVGEQRRNVSPGNAGTEADRVDRIGDVRDELEKTEEKPDHGHSDRGAVEEQS